VLIVAVKEVSVPSAASFVRKQGIIDRLKSFFGVRKEVEEIKISVTPEEFLKMSWKVGKKKLHQRKKAPATVGTDPSLFSRSYSDDCSSFLKAPAAVGTDTSVFSVSVSVDCCSLLKSPAAVGTDTSVCPYCCRGLL
jgi:hypothetical protein